MDIVDAQIHLFLTMNDREAIAAMDALGVQAAMIDEFWGYDGEHPAPGVVLPDGTFRPVAPGATMASMRHPDRFSWLLRVDPHDPSMQEQIEMVSASPQGRALRIEARSDAEVKAFAEGAYTPLFAAAGKAGLPVKVLSPGNADLLERYLRDCPDTKLVLDHIGMPKTLGAYERVLSLAQYPNAYIQWCHAPRVFGFTEYPFPQLTPLLKMAIDAFGVQRIMWASDFTAIRTGHRWSDALFYLRDNPGLSQDEKEWILGRTARSVFDWPAPAALSMPVLHRH